MPRGRTPPRRPETRNATQPLRVEQPSRNARDRYQPDGPTRPGRNQNQRQHGDERHSLYRNGLALALSGGLSALLGAGFWVIAARSTPRAELGEATALVSALMGLSMLGQLNLGPALTAFLPVTGRRRQLVIGSYTAAIVVSALLGAGFAIGAPRFTGSFTSLTNLPTAIVFSVGVAVWSLFGLQDAVLTGMRRATWVPVEMTSYNLLRFGLLAGLGGGSALFVLVSWLTPALLAIVPVSYLLFTRVLSSRQETEVGSDGRMFRRFLAGESTAMVFDQIGVTLLPVLVVAMLGSRTGAAFGLAWMMTTALNALVYGMGSSLVVEGSQPGADARALYLALRRRVLLALAAVVAVSEVGAPLLLQVFGAGYARDATTVFRLLVLASLPHSLIVLALCAARAERRIGWIVRVHLTLAILVPTTAALLCRHLGLAGAGLAWAGSQTVVALSILVYEARVPAPAKTLTSAPAGTFDSTRAPFDADTTTVIYRSSMLATGVMPHHAGLVDADMTVWIPRFRRRPDAPPGWVSPDRAWPGSTPAKEPASSGAIRPVRPRSRHSRR